MKATTVILQFPNIDREFAYEYPYDPKRDREEEAYREFYKQEAYTLFALYGYAPMDVTIKADGEVVGHYEACYQEYLWHVFFNELGGPWHGRFQRFTMSLMELRKHEEKKVA